MSSWETALKMERLGLLSRCLLLIRAMQAAAGAGAAGPRSKASHHSPQCLPGSRRGRRMPTGAWWGLTVLGASLKAPGHSQLRPPAPSTHPVGQAGDSAAGVPRAPEELLAHGAQGPQHCHELCVLMPEPQGSALLLSPKTLFSFLPSPRGSVQELWPNTGLTHPKSELYLFWGSNAKRVFDSGCPPLPFHRVWVCWQRLRARCRQGASPGTGRAPLDASLKDVLVLSPSHLANG